jgi:hypothetical protein
MSGNIRSADDWSREFNRICDSVATARSIVEGFAKWVWDNVVAKDVIPTQMPAEVSVALAALDQELRSIEKLGGNLRWYFCSNPSQKWLAGQQLTREEFYILAAQGIMIIPSESGLEDAYEEFTHYFYEDDKKRGYINPLEYPDSPPTPAGHGGWTYKVHLKVGIVPEEVRTSCLRPAQLDFFKSFEPELFSRFREN